MAFAEDLQKVQEITQKLGDEHTGLEQSIRYYEQGMALVKKLEQQLEAAKRKVETISGSAEEGLVSEPMEDQDA